MVGKTEIANRTASKLGQSRLSNVDTDDTVAAETIRDMWDNVRDAVLQSYPWNFAIKRATLAPDGGSPEWGWDYQYTFPSDYLSLIEIDGDPDYTIEADPATGLSKILTNEGTALYIRYISRVTSTGLFSPLFVEAFSTRLAYESCERITQNASKKELLLKEYGFVIDQAYTADAIETPPSELPEDEWLDARQ